jgi:two-component system, NarL family, nitrate/nitrite response regulator NarL
VNSATPPSMHSDSQVSGIQVFLIDDYQPALRTLIKLIQSGYPRVHLVGTASTRSAALTGVIRLQPEVVLLDYGLGNGDTLDFLSHLAVLGHHRILMLTGQQYTPELGRRALALGACGVISKEAPAELMLHAIDCAHRQGHWSELFAQINPVKERRHFSRQS